MSLLNDLIYDLSLLTGIGKYNLDELVSKSVAVISHDIEESLRSRQDVTSIDIGIGELHISYIDDSIFYKFIPSRKLENAIKNTYTDRKSELSLKIDAELGNRLTHTYKDLF